MLFRSQVLSILATFLIVFPTPVFASTYGSGLYGTGLYEGPTPTPTAVPTTSSGSSGSSANIPEAGCAQSAPGGSPWLYAAVAKDAHSILLYFTDAPDPVDHYVLQYGFIPSAYRWGASDIGKKGVRTYLVQSLASNTTYHFRVSGANGCASGAWSNDISATTTANRSLSPRQSDLILPVESIMLQPEPAVPEIPVSSPSAASATVLSDNIEYSLTVHVIDTIQKPVKGVDVILDGTTPSHTTDEHGGVTFEPLPSGDHSISISYQGKHAQSHVFLSGNEKSRELTMTIEKTPTPTTTPWRLIASAAAFVAVSLIGILLFIFRRKSKL